MARGEIFSARVERIAAGGAGVASYEGKRVFIDLTAPQDLVRCQIKKDHKTWAEAELLEILEGSPERSEPVCPLYGRCGGCALQHLIYETQIEAKITILKDAFSRIGGIDLQEIRIRRSSPFEYRNRLQFHKTDCNKPGFKERKSSKLVPLDDCPVADTGIRKALLNGKIQPPPGREKFAIFSRKKTFLCEGAIEQGWVSVLDKELKMDAGIFFQSNVAMLEFLIADLIGTASKADKTLPLADIYCGVGTFAAFIGGEFPEIDLVEENKISIALARENMPQGKKTNYYAMADNEWSKTQKKERSWGFIILDPPRKGLSLSMVEFLAENESELLAYVSCDPATLARDSRYLLEGGYSLKDITLYDFYPQTAHIESLAVFRRRKL